MLSKNKFRGFKNAKVYTNDDLFIKDKKIQRIIRNKAQEKRKNGENVIRVKCIEGKSGNLRRIKVESKNK